MPTFGWRASRACGINAEEIPVAEVLRQEPVLNPRISRAFRGARCLVYGFDVLTALGAAVQSHGGAVLTYHQVTGLILEKTASRRRHVRNVRTGEESHVRAEMVVNAAGPRGQADRGHGQLPGDLRPSKGTMSPWPTASSTRIITAAIFRADRRHPRPVGTVAVCGTTSVTVADPTISACYPGKYNGCWTKAKRWCPLKPGPSIARMGQA